jgi:hypothetical protein
VVMESHINFTETGGHCHEARLPLPYSLDVAWSVDFPVYPSLRLSKQRAVGDEAHPSEMVAPW